MFERILLPCVPQRAYLRPHLLAQLTREFPTVPVAVFEQSAGDTLAATIAPMYQMASGCADSYILNIEDDAQLAMGAGRAMRQDEKLCTGAKVVSFFSTKQRPCPSYERTIGFAVCMAVRADIALAYAAWYPEWRARHPEHICGYDIALNEFARGDIWTRFPSLAQHLPLKSTLSPRSTKRQSPTYMEVV